LSSQNLSSIGRKRSRAFSHKKGKAKVARLVTWDRNIVCIPKDYGVHGNSRVIAIPKGKGRASLQARVYVAKFSSFGDDRRGSIE
jgi:hypothetical protein